MINCKEFSFREDVQVRICVIAYAFMNRSDTFSLIPKVNQVYRTAILHFRVGLKCNLGVILFAFSFDCSR